MPDFVPVTKNAFAAKRWIRPTGYARAAKDVIAPLVIKELPKAQLALPIAFAKISAQFSPVAVLGLKPQTNALVNAQGQWLGRYIPAVYRGYPFMLANTEDGQQVLCFDQGSGLLSEGEGVPFFDDGGEPSSAVQDILNFHTQLQANRTATQRICSLLDDKKLIQPWLIKLQGGDNEVPVEGLFRIDEAALNALDKEILAELQQAGAMPVIYCQLLSMQHLQSLANIVSKGDQQQQTVDTPDIDKLFGQEDDLFHFD